MGDMQGRGGEQWGAELTAALQQCFGGSPSGAGAAFPPSSLGIIPGRTCWVLYVDAVVLAADGAVLDALALATKVCADTAAVLPSLVGSRRRCSCVTRHAGVTQTWRMRGNVFALGRWQRGGRGGLPPPRN